VELIIGLGMLGLLSIVAIAQGYLEREDDPRAGSLSILRAALLVLTAAVWLVFMAATQPVAALLAFALLLIWLLQQIIGSTLGKSELAKKTAVRLDGAITVWAKLVSPIRLSAPELVEEYEQDLLESVEEFSETIVREVMVPRVDLEVVSADDTLEQALSVFIASGYSRLPVIGENVDDVVGVLYLKDVARVTHRDPSLLSSVTARQASRKPLFTPESKSISALLQQMQVTRVQIAIITDEYGGVAGIATVEDLIEELVGEITDEYDREDEEIELVDVDLFRVSPRVTLDELSEYCEIELEDEDVDTVGGLLIKANGELPKGGEVVTVLGLELTAERVDARRGRILSILVRKLESEND
jgi:CBS domain containing-hemolysin-like protein